MIASKCILSVFPGNDVSHVPLRKARGWTVNHLWQWCWGQHDRKGTGSCRTMAKEMGGAVPGTKPRASQTRSLLSPSKSDLHVATNLTHTKNGSLS